VSVGVCDVAGFFAGAWELCDAATAVVFETGEICMMFS
jgi:hypothetical protein